MIQINVRAAKAQNKYIVSKFSGKVWNPSIKGLKFMNSIPFLKEKWGEILF